MRLLIRYTSAVALWLSASLILSACAVLTSPTLTSVISPLSPLPTSTAQSTATSPLPLSPLQTPTTQSTVKPSPTLATSPLVTPLPFASVAQVLELTFIDPQRGWFLALVCGTDHICPIVIHVTYNGGQTWQAMNAPLAEAIFSESNLSITKHVDALRFANTKVGWAFNPDFFSTRDGGTTWTDEKQIVVALEVLGQSVWAIEKQGNKLIVVTSNDLGQTWRPTDSQPELYSRVSLVRIDTQNAWILTLKEVEREAKLFATSNGGTTWQQKSLPLYAGRCTSLILAASHDKRLWFLCGDGLATAMQPKWLYISTDNGASWNLVSGNDPTGQSKTIGLIPISGHIFDSRGFAVTSSTTAFMALSRGTLYATHDGGSNWAAVGTEQPINLGDAAIGPMQFIDSTHGWLVAAGRIFRTGDGGVTWQIFPLQ